MRAEYDFSKAKRKALVPTAGKTRISIFIDNAILDAFRARAEAAGTGYQTMINEALRQSLSEGRRPLTEARLRAILEEIFPERARGPSRRAPRARASAG